MGTVRDDQCTFVVISHSLFLRITKFSGKFVERIKRHLFSLTFSKKFYGIMWESTAEPGRPQMTIEYSACALHAGYIRLQTHTQNM